MEWEDTVISEEQLQDDKYDGLKFDVDDIQYVLEAQAEISFEAGQETERRKLLYCEEHKLYYCDCCPDCFKKEGIKEVVEWARENDFYSGDDPAGICIERDKWQAALKEWGIDG